MSELDAALAVEPKQPVRTERNFALTKGIAGAVRCGTQARGPFRGQSRWFSDVRFISTLPLIADLGRKKRHVQKVPSSVSVYNHSITSSASATKFGGNSMPVDFAVIRL